jgi:hypothetical protein
MSICTSTMRQCTGARHSAICRAIWMSPKFQCTSNVSEDICSSVDHFNECNVIRDPDRDLTWTIQPSPPKRRTKLRWTLRRSEFGRDLVHRLYCIKLGEFLWGHGVVCRQALGVPFVRCVRVPRYLLASIPFHETVKDPNADRAECYCYCGNAYPDCDSGRESARLGGCRTRGW